MDEWDNPLGMLWDTRERDRSSRLASAAKRVADAMLVESTRPEAEYWPLLLPLPPRNSTKAVAVALTATSLGPLVAAPIAAACDGRGHTGGPHDRAPSGNGVAQTVGGAPPSPPAAAPAPAEPARAAAPAPAPPAVAPVPAAPAPAAAAPVPAAPAPAAAAPAPAAPAPVAAAPQPAAAPEDVATPRVEPVPLAKTPRLVPSSPSRPARRHRRHQHHTTPQITMQVDPEPVVAPRRHRHSTPVIEMHVTPERPARTLVVRVTLSAERSRYRVRSGDSLWRIAQSLVGSGAGSGRVVSTVHMLWSLNRGHIASGNENMLATSDVLVIPARHELS
jgi:hypothetical protein